jgi:hypothetical protein
MSQKVELKEWIKGFIKHKDIFTNSIIEIKDFDDDFLVKYKDKEIFFYVSDSLSEVLKRMQNSIVSIATLNTKANFDTLIQNWHTLTKDETLTIYFVNPNSKTENKWIIRPAIHNKIADEDTLKVGLESMFNTVEIV